MIISGLEETFVIRVVCSLVSSSAPCTLSVSVLFNVRLSPRTFSLSKSGKISPLLFSLSFVSFATFPVPHFLASCLCGLGLGVLWWYQWCLRLIHVMDGTGGRLYCCSCHATAFQSQSLGCKMERRSPGRADSLDITVKGFAVTRCYRLNYISPLSQIGSILLTSLWSWLLSLFRCFSHLLILCLALSPHISHKHTHICCHIVSFTRQTFVFSDPYSSEQTCLLLECL